MARHVLVTGGTGQVGRELAALEWPAGVELVLPGRAELDLGSRPSIQRYFATGDFAAVINCAAYTAVDRAESDVVAAYAANAFGPAWIAAETRRLDIPMVHVSTDYVFGGHAGRPREPQDAPAPTNVYGASKLAGEIAVLAANDRSTVIRTAWVFSPFGSNFLKTMLRLARDRDEIGVVNDQLGSPTSALDLAMALRTVTLAMINDHKAPTGVFHFVNDGEATWSDFAQEIMAVAAEAGLPTANIRPVSSAEFATVVERPADSRLSTASLKDAYKTRNPHWRDATRAVLYRIATEPNLEGLQ